MRKFNKKGVYFFLIDVLLVVFILFITIMTIANMRSTRPSLSGVDQVVNNLGNDFFTVEIRDYDTTNFVLQDMQQPGGPIYTYNIDKQMKLDELIVLLDILGENQNATALVREVADDILPRRFGINYSISDGATTTIIYYREALVQLEDSAVGLSTSKVTIPKANRTATYDPYITSIRVWQ